MKTLLGFLVWWLLAASPASATGNFTDCTNPLLVSAGATTRRALRSGFDQLCYQFDDTTDSLPFRVGGTALLCFDPDSAGAAGAARVQYQKCTSDVLGTVVAANVCIPIVDADVTGAGGSAAVQNACFRVGPGQYRIDVTIAPLGAEHAVVKIQGEGAEAR